MYRKERGGEDCFALFTSTRGGGFLRSEGERRGDADTRNGKKDLNLEKIEEEKEEKAHSYTWAQGVEKRTRGSLYMKCLCPPMVVSAAPISFFPLRSGYDIVKDAAKRASGGKKGDRRRKEERRAQVQFSSFSHHPFFSGIGFFGGKSEDELLLLLLCCVSAKSPPPPSSRDKEVEK